MKYEVTWQPPIAPDVYYRLQVESDAVTADLTLTVPEAIAAFTAIRDDEEYLPHSSRTWWVAVEHGRPIFKIEAIERFASVWASFPGEQVHAALEEILEHATQQEGDAA